MDNANTKDLIDAVLFGVNASLTITNSITVLAASICAGLSAYFGGYLRRKAEQKADEEAHDYKINLEREIVSASEQIKASIALLTNKKDRLDQLKRQKLEEFVSCLAELEGSVNATMEAILSGSFSFSTTTLPVPKLLSIQTLYFPQFENEVLEIIETIDALIKLSFQYTPNQIGVLTAAPQGLTSTAINLRDSLRKKIVFLMLKSQELMKSLNSEQ